MSFDDTIKSGAAILKNSFTVKIVQKIQNILIKVID